jgi:hypothetical protein
VCDAGVCLWGGEEVSTRRARAGLIGGAGGAANGCRAKCLCEPKGPSQRPQSLYSRPCARALRLILKAQGQLRQSLTWRLAEHKQERVLFVIASSGNRCEMLAHRSGVARGVASVASVAPRPAHLAWSAAPLQLRQAAAAAATATAAGARHRRGPPPVVAFSRSPSSSPPPPPLDPAVADVAITEPSEAVLALWRGASVSCSVVCLLFVVGAPAGPGALSLLSLLARSLQSHAPPTTPPHTHPDLPAPPPPPHLS